MSDKITQMYRLIEAWRKCTRCKIGEYAYKHVFGRGSIPAKILFIGEAPGRTEDFFGRPFVGTSGQLLDKIIAATGINISYYISNAVSCRPCDGPGKPNRAPTFEEQMNCYSRLSETVRIISPKIVILLGRSAQIAVIDRPWAKNYQIFGLPHPAYILRKGGEKSAEFKPYVRKLRRIFKDATAI